MTFPAKIIDPGAPVSNYEAACFAYLHAVFTLAPWIEYRDVAAIEALQALARTIARARLCAVRR